VTLVRFSIYLNPQTRGPDEDVAIVETTIEQAIRATTGGVQGVALTEHHFSGYNTYGNNFVLAAHLCGLTPRETPDVIESRLKLYADTLAKSGYDAGFIAEWLDWSLVQKQVIIRETDAEAAAFARERMAEMGAHQKKNFAITSDVKDGQHLRSVVGVSPQDPAEFLRKAMIVGSPGSVTEQLEAYASAGARHMSLLFNFGFMTAEQSRLSLDLFLQEVFPRFRAKAGTPS
jgi:alkanesulfonate monooxygenase SsuD/methylene tetrahydromethanopterin reductase-like flavin-dependent oxidoreductase (luciferase family)